MKSEHKNKAKYSNYFNNLLTIGGVFIFGFLMAMAFQKNAQASIGSVISSLFGGESVSAKIERESSSTNSQTVPILQYYAVNIDPTPGKQSDIVPVDNENTLNSDLARSNATGTDTSNMQISTYIVRQGDTISSVAKMFRVSTNTILWANDLTGKSVLKTGQTLVILPISGISYTVKRGDTIKGIAKHFGANAEDIDQFTNDILVYNDISMSTPIIVGQTIIVPDAELSADNVKPVNTSISIVAKCGSRDARIEPLLDAGKKLPAYTKYYARPISGGYRSQCLHGHNAIDLAAPVGTSLLASAGGTVIISKNNGGWNGGYGNYVVISHANGTQTLYAHMSKPTVSVGDVVKQGQRIGYIGMTGWTYGPHVHFEIRGAQNPF
ncbi:MAG: peptidoglycan DD-metalloendopeptidase family protein [Candidatus Taylorbacteria bacterium]